MHSHTLEVLSDLALVVLVQERYDEAETLIKSVIVGREKVLGKDHTKTVESTRVLEDVREKRIQSQQPKVTGKGHVFTPDMSNDRPEKSGGASSDHEI